MKSLEGSGREKQKYNDPMCGGFFIQSDNPFIKYSTTKRFL